MNDHFRKKGWLGMLFGLMVYGCSSSAYPPPTFEQKVDVSKTGVLYEADFSVPYNGRFAPHQFEFGVPHTQYELMLRIADTVPGRLEREKQEASDLLRKTGKRHINHITLWKVIGNWGDIDTFGKLSGGQLKTYVRAMENNGAPILLKITLTPHPGTRKPIEYITAKDRGTGRSSRLAPEQALEVVLDLSSFAQDGFSPGTGSPQHKLLLLLPRLELYGEYHLRIENLTPIALPPGIETSLVQRQARIMK